jgi:hypothetical protein
MILALSQGLPGLRARSTGLFVGSVQPKASCVRVCSIARLYVDIAQSSFVPLKHATGNFPTDSIPTATTLPFPK